MAVRSARPIPEYVGAFSIESLDDILLIYMRKSGQI